MINFWSWIGGGVRIEMVNKIKKMHFTPCPIHFAYARTRGIDRKYLNSLILELKIWICFKIYTDPGIDAAPKLHHKLVHYHLCTFSVSSIVSNTLSSPHTHSPFSPHFGWSSTLNSKIKSVPWRELRLKSSTTLHLECSIHQIASNWIDSLCGDNQMSFRH